MAESNGGAGVEAGGAAPSTEKAAGANGDVAMPEAKEDSKAESKPTDGAATVDAESKPTDGAAVKVEQVDLTKSTDEVHNPFAEVHNPFASPAGAAAKAEEAAKAGEAVNSREAAKPDEGKAGEAAKGSGKGELASKQILETQEDTMMGFAAVARGLRGKGKGKSKPAAPEAAKDAAKDAGVTETGQLAGGLTLQRAPSADFPLGLKLVRSSSGDLPNAKKAKRWQAKTKSAQNLEGPEPAASNGRPDGDAQTPASASSQPAGAAASSSTPAASSTAERPAEVPVYAVLMEEWKAQSDGKEEVPSYGELVERWRRRGAQPLVEPAGPAAALAPAPAAKAAPAPNASPSPSPPKEAPPAVPELPPFIPAEAFAGGKRGYKFSVGPKGLGYYLDEAQDRPDRVDEDKPQIPTTLYGSVFAQKDGEGCASYHFDSMDDCYISYTQPKEHWKLANGMRPPEKKPFAECSWDEESRTFCATVHWQPTFLGDTRWEYEMGFAEDFSCIEEGTLTTYGTDGAQRKMLNFGMDLHYNRHIIQKLKLKAKAKAAPKASVEDDDDGPPAPPLKSLTLARLKFLAKYHNISTQACLDIEDVIEKLSKAGVSDKMAAETPDEETLAMRAAVRRKAWKPAFAPTPYNHGDEIAGPPGSIPGMKGRTPGCKFGHPMILDTRDSNFRSKRYCDMCRHFGTQYTCSQRPRCDYDMCARCYEKGGHAVIGP